MKPWMKYALIFVLALAMWTGLHKLANVVNPPEVPMYSFEATACVQVRETAISEMVCARSTASALETHVAGAAFIAVTPEATLAVLETRVAEYECMWTDMLDVLVKAFPDSTPCALTPTAVTPEPTEAPTARPTMTVEFLPTATPTATPDPDCYPCSETNQTCPDNVNYYCRKCAAGKWRCVRRVSPASDCMQCLVQNIGTFPDVPSNGTSWIGLATWYNDSTGTASGEPFDATAMTGAVDCSGMSGLVDKSLHICTLPGFGVNSANCIDVRVNDCGPLTRAGLFVYESRPRGMLTITRWWPGDGDGALYIVVDLTKEAMNQLTEGSFETCAITMTIVE